MPGFWEKKDLPRAMPSTGNSLPLPLLQGVFLRAQACAEVLLDLLPAVQLGHADVEPVQRSAHWRCPSLLPRWSNGRLPREKGRTGKGREKGSCRIKRRGEIPNMLLHVEKTRLFGSFLYLGFQKLCRISTVFHLIGPKMLEKHPNLSSILRVAQRLDSH